MSFQKKFKFTFILTIISIFFGFVGVSIATEHIDRIAEEERQITAEEVFVDNCIVENKTLPSVKDYCKSKYRLDIMNLNANEVSNGD